MNSKNLERRLETRKRNYEELLKEVLLDGVKDSLGDQPKESSEQDGETETLKENSVQFNLSLMVQKAREQDKMLYKAIVRDKLLSKGMYLGVYQMFLEDIIVEKMLYPTKTIKEIAQKGVENFHRSGLQVNYVTMIKTSADKIRRYVPKYEKCKNGKNYKIVKEFVFKMIEEITS